MTTSKFTRHSPRLTRPETVSVRFNPPNPLRVSPKTIKAHGFRHVRYLLHSAVAKTTVFSCDVVLPQLREPRNHRLGGYEFSIIANCGFIYFHLLLPNAPPNTASPAIGWWKLRAEPSSQ